MNSIDFEINDEYENGVFLVKGRYCEFTPQIKKNFTKDKDICHGISFYCMSTAIVNAMNYFWYKNRDVKKTLEYIYGIIIAVKRITYDEARNLENISEYQDYLLKLEKVLNDVVAISNTEEKYFSVEHSIYYLNKILEKLYNEEKNLHSGDSSWNRSLGRAYDPIEFSCKNDEFILENEEDSIAITNLLNYTLGKNDDFPSENGLFFYTCIIDKAIFLYSSNIDIEFKKVTEVLKCEYPIKYLNYLKGEYQTIPVDIN